MKRLLKQLFIGWVSLIVALLPTSVLVGCRTIEGVDEPIEVAGDEIEEAGEHTS